MQQRMRTASERSTRYKGNANSSHGGQPLKTVIRCLPVLALLPMMAGRPALAATAPDGCHPLGYDKTALLELRAQGFAIEDPEERRRYAFEMLDCLGDPDPMLRDQIAFEGYTALLRGQQLDADTIRQLRIALLRDMATADEGDGFRRPFAALVLAEVARADRIEPVFSQDERAALVAAACAYMRSIDDYRGFDEATGWRHAVAHDADLLMQLALNPALDRAQLLEIRDAVASQVAPAGAHFYVYGEGERLARPILFIAMRGIFTQQEWTDWFGKVASPDPFGDWSAVFASQAGLAKLHNTKAFVTAIYVNATASENESLKTLVSPALDTLRALP